MPTPKRPAPPAADSPSPESQVERDPMTGQAVRDRSLETGEDDAQADGGARSSRHTGEDPKH